MSEVSFADFQKLDLRVGKIIEAEEIADSRSLMKLQVDFGSEKHQAIAGIKGFYKPENLIGRKFMFIVNLEKKKMMGKYLSECMIFAAEDSKGNIILMVPEKDIEIGAKVR